VANNQSFSSEMATVNEVHVYGTIGILLEFKPDDDWTVYKERTEQYFLANMIPEERKVPFLITCMGENAFMYYVKRFVRSFTTSPVYLRSIMYIINHTIWTENFIFS